MMDGWMDGNKLVLSQLLWKIWLNKKMTQLVLVVFLENFFRKQIVKLIGFVVMKRWLEYHNVKSKLVTH